MHTCIFLAEDLSSYSNVVVFLLLPRKIHCLACSLISSVLWWIHFFHSRHRTLVRSYHAIALVVSCERTRHPKLVNHVMCLCILHCRALSLFIVDFSLISGLASSIWHRERSQSLITTKFFRNLVRSPYIIYLVSDVFIRKIILHEHTQFTFPFSSILFQLLIKTISQLAQNLPVISWQKQCSPFQVIRPKMQKITDIWPTPIWWHTNTLMFKSANIMNEYSLVILQIPTYNLKTHM